jgi:penicillin amidase
VPGNGEYEWTGFVPNDEMPAFFNPPKHFVASANNKVIPSGYKHILTYEWGAPYRVNRVEELLSAPKKFSVADFQQMQYDVVSSPAKRFQKILKRWRAPAGRPSEAVQRILNWDARLTANSVPGMLFEIWMGKLPPVLFGADLARRADPESVLKKLETSSDLSMLGPTLISTVSDLDRYLGTNMDNWQWGRLTAVMFRHPLKVPEWSRGPIMRGGDPNTVDASGGGGSITPSGASYRQVIDLADWDRSTMTNVPGESGDPASPHYSDLIEDWATGQYHPMAFTRKAVEAVTTERITLLP